MIRDLIKKRDTSIPLDKWFAYIKPKYKYIKITPDKSIKNYNAINIAKAIKFTYKAMNKRIKIEQKKLWFETNFKISYIVDIKAKEASFYFMVPEVFIPLLVEKISEIWAKVTMEIIDKIEDHTKDVECYQVAYKKEDALSLNVDRRTAEPLNSILSVMEIMKDTDRITVVYNFQPRNNAGWTRDYNDTIKKFKEGKPIDRDKSNIQYIGLSALNIILGLMDSFFDTVAGIFGAEKQENNLGLVEALATALNENKQLSSSTTKKKDANVLDTQIVVMSDSIDKTRQENNGVSVCNAFKVLDEDNELVHKKVKKDFKLTDYMFNGIDINSFSVEEVTNFIQVPGRSLLKAFSNITQIKTNENPVPKELRKGYISLGNVTYKGQIIKSFLQDHKDIGSMPLYLAGQQGSGKSTYFANYANYASARNESVIYIDFIKNCEVSKDIEDSINKDKVIVLDFTTEEGIQAFAYNELKFNKDMSLFEVQQLANMKAQLTAELVDSINKTGDPLSPKMDRYLGAAANIVYLNEDATLRDVMKCLQDFKFREKIIKEIPLELEEELSEEIQCLQELDEWSKPTMNAPSEKIGTKDNKIEGIIDRLTLLKKNIYLKKMFNKNPKNNIDFVKVMEEGKVVLIRMKQSKFKKYIKNIITTFILTKCWLATEIRGELHDIPGRTHIMIDEINQTKTAEKYMESLLTETRKFGIKFVLTGQYLNQLDKDTIYTLKGAGTSFMFLNGTIEEDFNYFKSDFEDEFEYSDLKNMKEYHSLNLIKTTSGKATFISKLPIMKYKNEEKIIEAAINFYLIKICDDVIEDHYVFVIRDELHMSSDKNVVGDNKIIFKIAADTNIDCNKLYSDNIDGFFKHLEDNLHYKNIKEEFDEKGIRDYYSLADESFLYHIMFLKWALPEIMEKKLKEYKEKINFSK